MERISEFEVRFEGSKGYILDEEQVLPKRGAIVYSYACCIAIIAWRKKPREVRSIFTRLGEENEGGRAKLVLSNVIL